MRRLLLVSLSVLGSSCLGVTETYAQSAAGPTPDDGKVERDNLEEVTVTGTRVARAGFDAPTPLITLSTDQLSAANPGGPVDALRQLPILAFSTGPRGATGSAGQGGSFLNLRNLGANRTLVLLDGKRFVPTSGNGNVDISLFPTALIERLEIVTGGASAAYGSDAVTGVVNFILDRNFTGLKASAQGGISTFEDDEESKFSLAYGTDFAGGRGHVLLSGERYKSEGVYSLLDRPGGQKSCAPITNPGRATARTFACDVRSSQANFTGIISSGPTALRGMTFDNDGNPIPFNFGSLRSSTTMVGGDGLKPQFLPTAVPVDRDVYFGRASWDFSDNLVGYVEGTYGNSDYEYQIGSFSQNLGSTAIRISPENAYLSASMRAQLNYLTGTDWLHATVEEDNAAINFSGEPFSIWAGPVSLATGAEWRSESIVQTVAPEGLELNDVSGDPGPFRVGNYQAQSGSFDVLEGYVETIVPLVKDVPFVKSLDFNGAVRATDYSTSGSAVTWKAALSWSVTDDVRLRATRSRDQRSPNLTELYSGAVAGHNSIIDYPTSPTAVNAQALVLTRGNPALNPETGNTTTVGIVYQPQWAPGWQTSVDGYRIEIADAIVSIGAQELVRQCSLGNAVYCGAIIRDSAGGLFGVNNSPQNVQSLLTTGVDLETSYSFALQDILAWLKGNVSLRGLAYYVDTYETETLGVTTINLAGQLGQPRFRWTTQLAYEEGPWAGFVQARYSGSGYFDKRSAPTDLPQLKIGGQTLVDANLAHEFPMANGATSVYVNVTNIFNELPPPFTGLGQNYDPIGRFYRLGVKVEF